MFITKSKLFLIWPNLKKSTAALRTRQARVTRHVSRGGAAGAQAARAGDCHAERRVAVLAKLV